jgi:hypothetical protein
MPGMRQTWNLQMQTYRGGREGPQRQADYGLQQKLRGTETGRDSPQDQQAVMREGVASIQMLRLTQLLASVWL